MLCVASVRRLSARSLLWRTLGQPLCTQSGNDGDILISSSRTSTTSRLWKQRVEKDLLDEAKRKATAQQEAPNQPGHLISKSPKESLVSVDLAFASQPSQQEPYQSWMKGSVRFGKILEDLDALAGNIAHTHADDNNPHTRPLHIVTACVDRVDILRHFPLDKDLCMQGNVAYVGTSSMHIDVSVVEKNNPDHRILSSSFLMVARDENTGKSAPVNHLEISTDAEKLAWLRGEEAKTIRKKERNSGIARSLPTTEELQQVHQLYYPGAKEAVEEEAFDDSSRIPIHETILRSIAVTQPQEKNTKDKIFGGYLMRKAYELSMATALKFCGAQSNPFLLAIDEITFHRPVEIGSIVEFTASVVFTTQRACQIKVETMIHDLVKDERHRSNSFHLTFSTLSKIGIAPVRPCSYVEAMDYIDGRRRLHSSHEAAVQQESALTQYYSSDSW